MYKFQEIEQLCLDVWRIQGVKVSDNVPSLQWEMVKKQILYKVWKKFYFCF